MAKFGMYTKGTTETKSHISLVEVPSKHEAEAYFAGRKQMTLLQFHNLFIVKEINQSDSKNLLLG